MDDVESAEQGVGSISKKEVRAVINRMRNGKWVRSDDIHVEASDCLVELIV